MSTWKDTGTLGLYYKCQIASYCLLFLSALDHEGTKLCLQCDPDTKQIFPFMLHIIDILGSLKFGFASAENPFPPYLLPFLHV